MDPVKRSTDPLRKMNIRNRLKSFKGTVNHRQILIGLAGLLVGTLVYVIDRPLDHVYFLHSMGIQTSLHSIFPNVFGALGNNLPDFLHVFSFILLTAGMVSCGKRGGIVICAGWFLVECAFELGQKFNSWVLKIIPDSFAGIPYLENTKNFFLSGTFDSLDLLAICIGTATAYCVLIITMNRRPEHVTT